MFFFLMCCARLRVCTGGDGMRANSFSTILLQEVDGDIRREGEHTVMSTCIGGLVGGVLGSRWTQGTCMWICHIGTFL